MAKYEAKTKQTVLSPADFVAAMEDGPRKADAAAALAWMGQTTGLEPKMWGPSIIGSGRYAYTYDSGHSGEAMLTGFSPRKANLVFYIMPGIRDYAPQLARLGKHKTGKSCLYINKLSDIDMTVLAEIVRDGVAHMRQHHQTWDT